MRVDSRIFYESAGGRASKTGLTVHWPTRTSQGLLFSERFQQTLYHIGVSVLDKPAVYRIKVRGVVPESWIDRLQDMDIVSVASAATILEGWLPDQAALNGVLNTLYQLRLPLLEVTCLPPMRTVVSVPHEDEKR
jgi:hypothetical protein